MATKTIDLDYEPGTFASPFDDGERKAFEKWLRAGQLKRMRFDPAYLSHLRRFHGGKPRRRYFDTREGTPHVIERFLNFVSEEAGGPMVAYRVENTWGMYSDRLGDHLVPFAELFAGDLLCFDYGKPGSPRVVAWFHEQSRPGRPYTEEVADSFGEFLSLLSDQAMGKSPPAPKVHKLRQRRTRKLAPKRRREG